MGKKKNNWEKIRADYITSDISLRKLAEKYKTSTSKIYEHSRKEGWVEARKQHRKEIIEEAVGKACVKPIEVLADILDIAYKICDYIAEAVDDPDQFKRYLVKVGDGKGNYYTVEKVFGKYDTKAMKEMVYSIKDLASLILSIKGINTEAEQQRLDIQREKLQMLKERYGRNQGESQSEYGLIITFDTDGYDGWTE